MVGDHTYDLFYFALLCIACTQVSFSDYVSIKNQSIFALLCLACTQTNFSDYVSIKNRKKMEGRGGEEGG